MWLHVVALRELCEFVEREWGDVGYYVDELVRLDVAGSTVAVQVVCGVDGSRFWAAANVHGSTWHAETFPAVCAAVRGVSA